MAVASLTRITVPLGSDQSSPNQGLLMPKLKWRFRVTLENFGITSPKTELTKQVMDCTRPSVTFEEITVDVYNSKAYLAGKHSWEAITINLRDDASNTVTKLVGEQVQKQFDFMEQASAASGIDYKFTSRIEMLDGGNGVHAPNTLETWELYGCFVTSANYGELNYSSGADVATIALTVRFDNALQTPIGTGIGTDVSRTLGSVITG